MMARITGLSAAVREDIREAVTDAILYWPNAHLGVQAPLEDMHSAFNFIRSRVDRMGIHAAVGALRMDTYRYEDV